MDPNPTPPRQVEQERRLERFLSARKQPCLGCGARKYETQEPYAGHMVGCSLVETWRRHDG